MAFRERHGILVKIYPFVLHLVSSKKDQYGSKNKCFANVCDTMQADHPKNYFLQVLLQWTFSLVLTMQHEPPKNQPTISVCVAFMQFRP